MNNEKIGIFSEGVVEDDGGTTAEEPSEKYRLLTIATKLSKILYGVVKNEKKYKYKIME